MFDLPFGFGGYAERASGPVVDPNPVDPAPGKKKPKGIGKQYLQNMMNAMHGGLFMRGGAGIPTAMAFMGMPNLAARGAYGLGGFNYVSPPWMGMGAGGGGGGGKPKPPQKPDDPGVIAPVPGSGPQLLYPPPVGTGAQWRQTMRGR